MVDWKQIPKIDAHIHLLPDDVICANRGFDDPFVEFGSADAYHELMKAYNIVQAIVMPFNDPCMLAMDRSIQTVHANLHAIATGTHSGLLCFADIDIRQEIRQTLAELDRIFCDSASSFAGIKLHPSNTGYPIDGEYYDRIFQYAYERKLLVEVHSYPRTHLYDDVCAPKRIRNVLRKLPGLRLSVAHLGGFQFTELYGLNIYVNISAILPDLVNRFGVRKTNEILRTFGIEKLVFATDYPDSRCLRPNDIYCTYFDLLGQMDFTQEEAECICWLNARKMLGL